MGEIKTTKRNKKFALVEKFFAQALSLVRFLATKISRPFLHVHRWLERHSKKYSELSIYLHHHRKQKIIINASLLAIVTLLILRLTAFASDVNKIWNFSNPTDYTLSDNSRLEYSGNSVRLKTQNYSSDSSTSALFHLDESSGSSATDSSSNGNNGTTINSPTWTTGNLNNALSLNGTNQSISVPDSSPLSLTQSNSLEAWTKLNSSFSANSQNSDQVIVDKGSYKLHYNHDTGKINYELENSGANSWVQKAGDGIDGSWLNIGPSATTASVVKNNEIIVGNNAGGQVWKSSGSTWTQIGGDGLNNGWPAGNYDAVGSLASDGTNVYAGFNNGTGDADVWKWNGSNWTKIGGDGINSGWAASTYESVSGLTYMSGDLYAGLGNGAGDGEVWKWNGSSWTKIGGDGINSGFTIPLVSTLTNDGTNIYAGTGTAAGDGDLWKWNGSSWSQIGGDGINSSWAASTYEQVLSTFYQAGSLYVGLGTSTGDAEVWKWNGSAWSRLAYSGSGFPAATYEGVYSITGDGTNIYAGTGNSQNDGDVWKYNGSSWSQIGGDALNSGWTQGYYVYSMTWFNSKLFADSTQASSGDVMYSWNGSSWSREAGQFYNASWGALGDSMVSATTTVNDKLYVGQYGANGGGGFAVFEYSDSGWKNIGTPGYNGSVSLSSSGIVSMTSMAGNLYVGSTSGSGGDADVWKWDGSSWTQIGGDSLNSSWNTAYTRISSLTSDGTNIYAGIGSVNGNGEVWKWNGSSWSRIGGAGVNSSWNGTYRQIYSLTYWDGNLYVGSYGSLYGSGDVWKWNGSNWSQIGGDGINSSWNFNATYNGEVGSIVVYDNKLYAGIGSLSTGDASLWSWDGTSWTKMGGDDINGSWTGGTYERVGSMAVYNGQLFIGLGSSGSNGEVWRYNGSNWSKIGGDSLNGGWGSAIESVRTLQVYRGKLYAGLGDNQNGDSKLFAYGNNAILQSNTSSFNTDWRHIAATYDGSSMKLYINGVLENSKDVSLSMSDSTNKLYIGQSNGSPGAGLSESYYKGNIDELRISNIARTSFTTSPYTADPVTIMLKNSDYKSGIASWDGFSSSETTNGGAVSYRLSDDGGVNWKFWNGSGWANSSTLSQSNTVSDINAHISSFPVSTGGLTWQAILDGDGKQQVQLNSVSLAATSDTTPPAANASNIVMKKSSSGPIVSSDSWTNTEQPYFSWTPANDSQSTIKGYCLYLGTDDTADPVSTKGLLGSSPIATNDICQFMISSSSIDLSTSGYLGSVLTSSNSKYYLKIKAVDSAGNIYNGSSTSFSFKFDNTQPSNPLFISTPSQFLANRQVTITWPTADSNSANDSHSGVAGLQYKIGSDGTWYGDSHSGSQDINDLLANDGTYQTIDPEDYSKLNDGNNTIYFRTYDNAGNVSNTYVTGVIRINTSSPTTPQNVTSTPASNTQNSFAFSWQPPASFFGSATNLVYCYTINTLPTVNSCNYTAAGVTSLPSGAYATQPGENTFYVVAKDEAGNINYATEAHTTFTANTSAPGLPRNLDIVDISVKVTSNWRLAIAWDEPENTGAGVANYKIYRSMDDSNYTNIATTAGTSYVDANLSQAKYYYKIKACDSANNCGALTSSVSEKPTGKFTSPANITSQPKVTSTSTRKATINWVTERESDSRIQYGVKSGEYFSTEAAISAQVTDHEVLLNNLAAGTTYYAKARWTDEDGNTGQTEEFTFKTSPAPVVKEVVANASLSGADINFSTKDAAKVKLYYGKTESFGGTQTLNTSLSESKYAMNINGLDDGTKYFFKINTFDSDNNEYEGNVYSFTTPPRPRISNLRFQPVEDQPSSTQKITWNTNVPATSEITYGIDRATQTVSSQKLTTNHEIIIQSLSDDSNYVLIARSRDTSGNLAVSDQQNFRTALDTRPPKITDEIIDTTIRGTGTEARGQVVVSWKTDEPATSQVAYGEGSSGFLSNITSEDAKMTTDHVVVISGLSTSRVYHFEPRSFDKAKNESRGEQKVAIVGRASENVLSIIFNALQKIFGIN